MHDGYIFTIGICGSAGGPAQASLDVMLAAIPPVKRAAFLGPVLIADGPPALDDPLTAPIRADIADAELIMIAAPLEGVALPARLRDLARAVESAPPPPRPRYALLVAVGAPDERALDPLRRLCASAGAEIVAELWLAAGDDLAGPDRRRLEDGARAAYARARALAPEALPSQV